MYQHDYYIIKMLFCQQVRKIFPENANKKLRQKPSPVGEGVSRKADGWGVFSDFWHLIRLFATQKSTFPSRGRLSVSIKSVSKIDFVILHKIEMQRAFLREVAALIIFWLNWVFTHSPSVFCFAKASSLLEGAYPFVQFFIFIFSIYLFRFFLTILWLDIEKNRKLSYNDKYEFNAWIFPERRSYLGVSRIL